MTNTQHLKAARVFAKMMDNQFSFLGVNFGIEAIIGIVPGIGDLIGFVLSCYLLWIGYLMNLPPYTLLRMFFNVMVDGIVGSVPIVGDIADVFFHANMRNLAILEEFAKHQHHGETVLEGEVIS